ncbi:hypothetical protein BBJ28_00023116, partial [Nothophytophthora sp. Chile5]
HLIRPFASFVHDKVDGLCQELGSAKILAAEYVSHNERLQTELTEMEDLRADYDALERQAAEQEGKQATRIRELELQLSAAQVNPPSTPSRDLQLLVLASAKDAALTEVSGQRRRIEILEAGQQTLKDRIERERADRAFEADRLQTKFRQQRNQVRDQQTKARVDLAAAMGARSRALTDAAELRKSRVNSLSPRGDLRSLSPSSLLFCSTGRQVDPMRANVARLELRVSDLQRSSLQAQRESSALRRERDAARDDRDQVQQRLATVASALGHPPGQPVPPKRLRSAPVAGGSADPDVTRPRKSRRVAADPKEESKTEDAGVIAKASAAPGNAVADDSDGARGKGGISSDDDAVRVALTRSRSYVRRSSVEGPGSAESSIFLEDPGAASDTSEQEWTPSDRAAASSPSADTSRLPAVFTCVPGFSRAHAFRAGKITPWIPSEIGGLSVTGLTVEILSKRRLHQPGFHFGVRRKTPPTST